MGTPASYAAPPGGPGLPARPFEAIRRAQEGSGGLLLLSGDVRSERRALVRALAQEAKGRGLEHVELRAHPWEVAVPYGSLHPWLAKWYRPVLSSENPDRARLSASLSMALAGLMSQPGEEGGPAPTALSPAARGPARRPLPETPRPEAREAGLPALSPEEMRAELFDLIEGQARQRPALITLEDAEYLDPSSRDWVAFLHPRLQKLPLLLALTLDPRSDALTDWRRKVPEADPAWVSVRGAPKPFERTPSLPERLRPLPPRALDALAAIVVAGPEAKVSRVSQVLGWTEEELLHAASPALDAGMIDLLEGSYELLEPELHPDLLGSVSRSRAASLHRAVARSIELEDPHPRGARLFRLGEHWAEAGEVAAGYSALVASAAEAERWGSPELAEGRLLRAVVLSQQDPTSRGRELEERAYAQLSSIRLRASNPKGSADAASRALALAQERGTRPVQWARYVATLADAQVRLGGDPESKLKETLALVQGRSSDLEATLLRSLSYYYTERGRSDLGAQTAERACQLAEKGSDSTLKVRTHAVAANAYIFGGDSTEKARSHLEAALSHRSELEGTADVGLMVALMDGLSNVSCLLGDEALAVRRGEEALAAARHYGYRSSLLLVLGNLAEHQVEAGHTDRARELIDELEAMCDRRGLGDTDTSRQQLLLLKGRYAVARGELGEGARWLERLVAASEKGGGRYMLGQALFHLTVLGVQRGDLEGARRQARRIEREGLRRTLLGPQRSALEQVEARLFPTSPASAPPKSAGR